MKKNDTNAVIIERIDNLKDYCKDRFDKNEIQFKYINEVIQKHGLLINTLKSNQDNYIEFGKVNKKDGQWVWNAFLSVMVIIIMILTLYQGV
jgi:hypothetical protein